MGRECGKHIHPVNKVWIASVRVLVFTKLQVTGRYFLVKYPQISAGQISSKVLVPRFPTRTALERPWKNNNSTAVIKKIYIKEEKQKKNHLD